MKSMYTHCRWNSLNTFWLIQHPKRVARLCVIDIYCTIRDLGGESYNSLFTFASVLIRNYSIFNITRYSISIFSPRSTFLAACILFEAFLSTLSIHWEALCNDVHCFSWSLFRSLLSNSNFFSSVSFHAIPFEKCVFLLSTLALHFPKLCQRLLIESLRSSTHEAWCFGVDWGPQLRFRWLGPLWIRGKGSSVPFQAHRYPQDPDCPCTIHRSDINTPQIVTLWSHGTAGRRLL